MCLVYEHVDGMTLAQHLAKVSVRVHTHTYRGCASSIAQYRVNLVNCEFALCQLVVQIHWFVHIR